MFRTYSQYQHINENTAEAKALVNKLISANKLPADELTNPESAYNKIKIMLGNNLGNMGYFVAKYYEKPSEGTLRMLDKLWNWLNQLKKYKIKFDLNQYKNRPLQDLLKDVQLSLGAKNIPGLVVDEHDETKHIANLTKDYKIVICVSKIGGKWVSDPDAVKFWGSPTWCIQSEATFKGTYVKTNNHLQYIFIHKNIFDEIKYAGIMKQDSKVKVVPYNYPHISGSGQSDYDPWFDQNHRIGITTKPTDISDITQTIDSIQRKTFSYTVSNDLNSMINDSTVVEKLGTSVQIIDKEVRNALNLMPSSANLDDIKFVDIIQYLDIDINNKEDEQLKNNVVKFKKFIDKIKSTSLYTDQYQKYIVPFFEQNPELIWTHQFMFFHAKKLSKELIDAFSELYNVSFEEHSKLPFNYISTLLHYFMILTKEEKNIMDPNFARAFGKGVVDNYFLPNIEDTPLKDSPKEYQDFKSIMLQVFYVGHYDMAKMPSFGSRAQVLLAFILVAHYLHTHDYQKGKQIIEKYEWDQEYKIVKGLLDILNDPDSKNSDITFEKPKVQEFLIKLIKNLQYSLSEIVQNPSTGQVEYKTQNIEYVIRSIMAADSSIELTYNPLKHNTFLYIVLKHFLMTHPEIKKQLEEESK
jgi:hypothetical protein